MSDALLLRGIDVLKLLTQTNLWKICTNVRGHLSDDGFFRTITKAIRLNDKCSGKPISSFPTEMRPVRLPAHGGGSATIVFKGKKRTLD